ncbi:MAG: 50S ribosomal protein L21e [Candidatus Lokiarchaeota archaeon]|nr:50S ribosomal protein L21e [Candidatus Lokiarchaeota archaeon]
MTKHRGYRKKTRHKHRKNVRNRGLGSIEKYLIDYEVNDKVDIITDPSVHRRGMPHSRFHGRTGTITGQRGRCYLVEVKLGNSMKTLIIGKEHIRLNSVSIKAKE